MLLSFANVFLCQQYIIRNLLNIKVICVFVCNYFVYLLFLFFVVCCLFISFLGVII